MTLKWLFVYLLFFYSALPYHVSIIFCLDSQCETLKWPLNFSCHTFCCFEISTGCEKYYQNFFFTGDFLCVKIFFIKVMCRLRLRGCQVIQKSKNVLKGMKHRVVIERRKQNWSDFFMYWLEIHCWHMNLCHWLHYVMLNKYREEDSAEVKNNNSCECLSTTVVQ